MNRFFVKNLKVRKAIFPIDISQKQFHNSRTMKKSIYLIFAILTFAGTATAKTIVYYFHSSVRCVTCVKIERYTYEAVNGQFAEHLKAGSIELQSINTDEQENKHYLEDYGLYTKSVVLSKIEDGEEVEFQNLDEIWNLVRNEDDFKAYIGDEIREFIEEDATTAPLAPPSDSPSLLIILTALWLGILTSISPCPLASNIAAISFIGSRIGAPRYVLTSGLVYTLGRTVFYTALGVSLSFVMHTIPAVSDFLQTKATLIIAPAIIAAGIVLLDILPIKLPALKLTGINEKRLSRFGLPGSFLIGFFFASALCPVSAALFFSNLVNAKGSVLALILYGIGTGLPVLALSAALAFFTGKIAAFYNATAAFEKKARLLTAVIFIALGIYSLWNALS